MLIIQRISLLLFSILVCSCGTAGAPGGSPTLPPGGASPQIFSKYSPTGRAALAGGWASTMDMSGVAFDNPRTATLITPRHVVMAKHYARGAGDSVAFHDRSGQVAKRKLIGFRPLPSDVIIGLLDEPLPSNYHPYALPVKNSDPSALIGRPALVSDKDRNLFVHLISNIGGGVISFRYDPAERYGWGKNLIVGDSGNPSFLIVGKELVLIETHTTGGPGAGPYYGDPSVQVALVEAVRELDNSYRIRTVAIR